MTALTAGCGGGDAGPALDLTIGADFSTASDRATVSGTMSLPAGSERSGGTIVMPIVTCRLGPYTLTWSNAATGAQGGAFAVWDCPDERAKWSAFGIGLAPGANRIIVVLVDDVGRAQATITVTRQ